MQKNVSSQTSKSWEFPPIAKFPHCPASYGGPEGHMLYHVCMYGIYMQGIVPLLVQFLVCNYM